MQTKIVDVHGAQAHLVELSGLSNKFLDISPWSPASR
jgi:hypothetical protein